MRSDGKRILRGLMTAALTGAMAAGAAIGGVALAQDGPISAQAQIPSRYDLREQGVVTPVKFQNPWGTCWAFGGIAAAETSILSDTGTTFAKTPLDLSEKHLAWYALHPITESEHADQAGEGFVVAPAEGVSEQEAVYDNGGFPIYITTLFSSGTGPLPETAFPYRGKEGIVESDYYRQHWDELLESYVEQYGEQYPDLDEASVRKMAEEDLQATFERLLQKDCYAKEDDWTIPEKDEKGNPNRLFFGGYTLRDGNVLPEVAVRGDETEEAPYGEWLGLSEDGMRAMKQEMLNGRAVSVVYHADVSLPGQSENGEYLNLDTWAQYTFDDAMPNHAVCVVGWDDNYPAQNFTHRVFAEDENGDMVEDPERSKLTTPPGNGAWIVKNSWGSETDAVKDGLTLADGTKKDFNRMNWGVRNDAGQATGYFYLSYYDKSLMMPETMDFDSDLDRNERGFYAAQYDYMPSELGFWELRSYDNVTSANVFEIDEACDLHSVSSRTFEENTRVTFKVYKLKAKAANPEDGELVASLSKNFEYAGFHRVDLSQPVSLKKGARFSVVVTVSTVDDEGARIYGVEASTAISKESLDKLGEEYSSYAVAIVNPGESYLQLGQNWIDWADYQKTDEFKQSSVIEYGDDVLETCVDNFAIKAYLVPVA